MKSDSNIEFNAQMLQSLNPEDSCERQNAYDSASIDDQSKMNGFETNSHTNYIKELLKKQMNFPASVISALEQFIELKVHSMLNGRNNILHSQVIKKYEH